MKLLLSFRCPLWLFYKFFLSLRIDFSQNSKFTESRRKQIKSARTDPRWLKWIHRSVAYSRTRACCSILWILTFDKNPFLNIIHVSNISSIVVLCKSQLIPINLLWRCCINERVVKVKTIWTPFQNFTSRILKTFGTLDHIYIYQ